ncbi:MAG: hypothetical protein LBO00_02595 [Zoogloeaceae bacterium]|jgi:hypothetical protein|nr:hypothetical protein [Zoogloeaceae bacterium]
MSNNLEQFRQDFLAAMRADILAVNPASATPETKILQSAMLKAYDFVDQYQALSAERTAMILEMSASEFAAWIALPRNQFALVETLADPVAVEIIFRDASAANLIAQSETAMSALVVSPQSMSTLLASATAMTIIAASEVAVPLLIANTSAWAATLASATAMTIIAASSLALWHAVKNASARSALAQSSYLQVNEAAIRATLDGNPTRFAKKTNDANLTGFVYTNTSGWVGKSGANGISYGTNASQQYAEGEILVLVILLGSNAGDSESRTGTAQARHLSTNNNAVTASLKKNYANQTARGVCVGGARFTTSTSSESGGVRFNAYLAI